MEKENIKKILIIQTAFLGDIVLTIPLINNVKKMFFSSKIYVLTTPIGQKILKYQKVVDNILVYDKKGKDKGFFKFLDFVNILKVFNFDIVLCPHRSFRSGMLCFLSGIKTRYGFSNSQIKFCFNKIVPFKKDLYELERNLYFLQDFQENFDINTLDKTINFPLNNEKEKNSFYLLKKYLNKSIITIHVSSRWKTKKWPYKNFIKVIEYFSKKNFLVTVLGDKKKDIEINQYLLSNQNNTNIINLIGKTSIDDLISIIRNSNIYITNDSGPMHIAAALNIPIVAIFGPTTKSLGFFPYTQKAIVLEKKVHCRPCSKHGGDTCKKGHFDCMNKISYEEVIEATLKLL